MSLPKEPRQKMINLMYLVLTALLALNVSNEILNAFKTLSASIDKSNISINETNDELYGQIKANEALPGQADKVRPYREKADVVKASADSMIKYLDDLKRRVVMEAGGYSKSLDSNERAFPDRMDNIDATTDILVEKKGGDTLKRKITEMRSFLLTSVPRDSSRLAPLMPLRVEPAHKNDHNPTGDWNIGNFEHMPAIAALALFSKYQNDVRSSEALVLKTLFENAHAKDIKFDTLAAIAVPTTSYALVGQKIEAEILLAAFNKKNIPKVTITSGGGTTKPAVNGVVPWETTASGTGEQKVAGQVVLDMGNGIMETHHFDFKYMVGSTGASMQLDKMNVFYIGVDNPVTVAAAGYSIEDVSIDAPGAGIKEDATAGKGHYNITVDKVGDMQVSIMAKTQDGARKQVGGLKVRVKRIPNPIPSLAGKQGGFLPASTARVQMGPAALLDNFDFQARFIVVGFTVSMKPKLGDLQGPLTNYNLKGARFGDKPDIDRLIKASKIGDKLFIEDIKVIGPDNQVRTLPGALVFNLN